MASSTTTLDEELQILFGALCDGLRQEMRARWLARPMIPITPIKYEISLTKVREREVASSLYFQLRSSGYFVQPESYFADADERLTPDFRIWLPVNRRFLFLEFKLVAWGRTEGTNWQKVWDDMRKLVKLGDAAQPNLPNGLLIIGFNNPNEHPTNTLQERFQKHSNNIITKHPNYACIGLRKLNVKGMDPDTEYAMVSLRVRKPD